MPKKSNTTGVAAVAIRKWEVVEEYDIVMGCGLENTVTGKHQQKPKKFRHCLAAAIISQD